MALPVSLHEIADEMGGLPDQATMYLNRRTGEVIMALEDDFLDEEDEADYSSPEEREYRAKVHEAQDSDDWLELPSKFDIHEYAIMQRFCESVESDNLRAELLEAIAGRGAFRCFKNAIHRHGIQDDWRRYRDEALQRIAREWLEANEIPYRA